MREGIYSTFRLGAYEPVKGLLAGSKIDIPFWKKVMAGAITGAIGSALANPVDLVKIRMQAQRKLKPGIIVFLRRYIIFLLGYTP